MHLYRDTVQSADLKDAYQGKQNPKLPIPWIIPVKCIIFKDFTYLFLERGKGKEKERNTDV